MATQNTSNQINNFTKGLLTEFTGLNFPENAATDTDNCVYTLVGEVLRRDGIDLEANGVYNNTTPGSEGRATYKWNNAGGDGLTQMVVVQLGTVLYFYQSSAATDASPLSTQRITSSTISVDAFLASGATYDPTLECTFADGNGYLFVYHPNCDPFYVTYASGVVSGNIISIQIRDFTGASEPNVAVNTRPAIISSNHLYNLSNQGWTQGNPWAATANNSVTVNTGNKSFTVAGSISGVTNGTGVTIYNNSPITPGSQPTIPAGTQIMAGNVQSYSGTTMVITVTSFLPALAGNATSGSLNIIPSNVGFINTWLADIGNYPSNSDVWWYFKDDTNVFNPTTTISNVNFNLGQAPQGHYVLPAFAQDRALVAGIAGLTLNTVSTIKRPTNGAWFQGRVWFTGVSAQQPAVGSAAYYTWTENVYFSQVVTTPADFGSCYQVNDPTSQDLNGLLPTDGGVITIPGAGAIYKLFPIANGMIVFASNGVWYITGSRGIGFSADDYVITNLSYIRTLSNNSFVNVNGLPYFWNEEGIYMVEPSQQGGMQVNPITVGTILTFYNEIPLVSKQYARAAYDPIGYIVQWLYRSTEETGPSDRYSYDRVLNLNTYNKAFYPYTVDTTKGQINSIVYVANPGGLGADSAIKFLIYTANGVSFGQEFDTSYVDWNSLGGTNYVSYFITGFRMPGKSLLKFQPVYIYVYSNSEVPTSYYINGIWDYANTANSGRYSTQQQVNNWSPNFDVVMRKHKIRGHGLALQLQVKSVDGQPFDIIGWSSYEQMNAGI